MVMLAWWAFFAPLVAWVLAGLAGRGRERVAAGVAIAGAASGFVALAVLAAWRWGEPGLVSAVPWVSAGSFRADLGVILDPLSLVMGMVVTGVGSLVFIYSTGYMAEDPDRSRYFACLSLFLHAMLGIVFAPNLVQLFAYWELVGVSSYLLIGFWRERDAPAEAGKKAFLVNRLADVGFLAGIVVLWLLGRSGGLENSLNVTEWAAALREAPSDPAVTGLLTLAAALLVCGVAGKSAQFPLHIWLPDAMEGPTPVSALIHAATMVAAGIYLLCRMFPLFAAAPAVLTGLAWLGWITAVMAGLVALLQQDIKKILAYSTVSQLGFMVMAVGVHAPNAAFFHLSTHACFKALLFLGAGAVIHALHTQDIGGMGGLWRRLPGVSWMFGLGVAALCGLFPLAGFWSKDAILAGAWEHDRLFFWLGLLVSALTATYMGRLFWVAFWNPASGGSGGHGHEGAEHGHGVPAVMMAPMGVLAAGSVLAGFLPIAALVSGEAGGHHEGWAVPMFSTLAAVGGLSASYLLWARGQGAGMRSRVRAALAGGAGALSVDRGSQWLVGHVSDPGAGAVAWFERWILMGVLVNGAAKATAMAGDGLRRMQTGSVQVYASWLAAGIVGLMALYSFL